MLKLRFFFFFFQRPFSGSETIQLFLRVSRMVSVMVVWLSRIILWPAEATRRFTETLNVTPSAMSGEICCEKAAAVLETLRCREAEISWIPLYSILKGGLRSGEMDAVLMRKTWPARAAFLSSARLLFMDLTRAE